MFHVEHFNRLIELRNEKSLTCLPKEINSGQKNIRKALDEASFSATFNKPCTCNVECVLRLLSLPFPYKTELGQKEGCTNVLNYIVFGRFRIFRLLQTNECVTERKNKKPKKHPENGVL